MTIPILKIKVLAKPVIKGKMDVRFPANVSVEEFLTVAKANGIYTFGVDYTLLDVSPVIDPNATLIAVYDETSQSFKAVSISSLQISSVEQHITAAGPAAVNSNTAIVRVDQTVGAPITINMPKGADKSCGALVADWKFDAGTNPITIMPFGSEKIQGRSSWTIAADGGSVFLRPIPGVGYVI